MEGDSDGIRALRSVRVPETIDLAKITSLSSAQACLVCSTNPFCSRFVAMRLYLAKRQVAHFDTVGVTPLLLSGVSTKTVRMTIYPDGFCYCTGNVATPSLVNKRLKIQRTESPLLSRNEANLRGDDAGREARMCPFRF